MRLHGQWAVLLAGACALIASGAGAETYHLAVTPQTVAWGNYDAAAKPVLKIKSGDTVVIDTLITSNPTALAKAGVPDAQIQQSLKDVYEKVPVKDRGPGGHILTGPVYVEGAQPGDTLEVRILKIDLAVPYAYNAFRFGAGFLPDEFPYSRMKLIPLDKTRWVADFGPGIEVPLHPFFGSAGVAPPPEFGRYDSVPPTISGGNMDDHSLVAGTSIFYPVWAEGGLFEVGDGHAGQGNGEVDITALETSLQGTFQFILHKGPGKSNYPQGVKTTFPRAETPTSYISMGFDDDLTEATRKAILSMIDFLVAEKHMDRGDAYQLISVAGDVEITELVDRNKGVHVVLSKSLFTGK